MHIRCPNGHVLAVPEGHAGKKVQCPACQTIMVVPAVAAPPEPVARLIEPGPGQAAPEQYEDEDYYEDAREAKSRRREGLRKVRTGLGLLLWEVGVRVGGAMLLVLIAFLVLGVAVAGMKKNPGFGGAANAPPPGLLGGAALIVILAVGYSLTILVLAIAGKCFCLSVPRDSGAYELILASLVSDVLGLLVYLAGVMVETVPILNLAGMALTFAGYLLFLFGLKRLAEYLRKRWLADSCGNLILWTLLLGGGMIFNFIVAIFVPLLGILILVFLIGLLVLLILYIRLLMDFRSVLT